MNLSFSREDFWHWLFENGVLAIHSEQADLLTTSGYLLGVARMRQIRSIEGKKTKKNNLGGMRIGMKTV